MSACVVDTSVNHLKLNLDEKKLIFLSGRAFSFRDLSINIENSAVFPAQPARNLGVTLNDQLSFTANIAMSTNSSRFILQNIRICPFLIQVLVQGLVILHAAYWKLLLACVPACATATHPECSSIAGQQVFCYPGSTMIKILATVLVLLDIHCSYYCYLSHSHYYYINIILYISMYTYYLIWYSLVLLFQVLFLRFSSSVTFCFTSRVFLSLWLFDLFHQCALVPLSI